MDEDERWEKAIKHAKYMLGVYQELGATGAFGAVLIQRDIDLYEKGDRSDALLEEIEGIK